MQNKRVATSRLPASTRASVPQKNPNLSKFNYTYDDEGQIQTWSKQKGADPARLGAYAHDLADRLTAASNATFTDAELLGAVRPLEPDREVSSRFGWEIHMVKSVPLYAQIASSAATRNLE